MAATLHDSDIGTGDGFGTSLSATAIDCTVDDLICVAVKYEGAVDTGVSVTFNQTVTNTGSGSNKAHANGDLNTRIFYARATTTGTIVATMNTASRQWRKIHAFTFTPGSGTVLAFDVEATAGTGTSGTASTSAASVTAAGVAFNAFGYYTSITSTIGSGWTAGQGATSQAAYTQYRFPTGAGSITGTCGMSGSAEWVAVMSAFKEEASGGTSITSGLGSLTITGFAPTLVNSGNNVTRAPALGQLTLSGLAPALVNSGNNVNLASGLGALTINGFAPTLGNSISVATGLGALTLTGFAPSQTLTVPSPGPAELVIAGFAPTINVGAGVSISTGIGALVISGLAPTATQQLNISTGLGSLTLTGLAPSFQTGDAAIIPGLAQMLLNGFPPDVLGGDAYASNQGGGRSKRKRRKYELEIDGEVFDVESETEAVEILNLLKEEAQKLAELAVNRANKAQKRPQRKVLADARKTLVVPEIQASSVIEDAVSSVRAEIENIYKSALDTIEIGTLLKKKEESDDDDEYALLMLL